MRLLGVGQSCLGALGGWARHLAVLEPGFRRRLGNLERSGGLIRDGRGWNTCRLGH
ncbi:hypothetical protein [Streptomyces carpinensis]|uniref:Transposase n=1 Tax=Streptomyces carpinensis TaxID=66369 RepID=A0ABV1W382_9ACTN|nr:hypothetical protein [Streptomyces carpinensis]